MLDEFDAVMLFIAAEQQSRTEQEQPTHNIRFHDLRHSCASLMVTKGEGINNVQEWLGHSDISTTANIYSHLDYKSKLTSANVMDNVLTLPETEAVGWLT